MSTSTDDGYSYGDLRAPTSARWETEVEYKSLSPWTDPDTGFSQVPFLAAPPGFGSQTISEARYHAFVSGVGAGKTVAGILRMVANMEEWNPGEQGMVVGPTVPHLKNAILPEMRRWGLLDYFEYRGKGGEQPGLISPNGSRAILESADNERKIQRLRGPSLAWIWIDEAAQLPRKVWEILVARLRAGEYRNAFVTTTPRGYDWVYDRFYGSGEGPPDDVNLIYGVPSLANPTLPEDYGSITNEYQGHFHDQEVLGLFVQPEGLVYPMFTPENVIAHEAIPGNIKRMMYGVDWGFTNPSALLAVMETRTGEFYVVDEFYERRCTTGDLAVEAGRMEARWGPGTWFCDPSEPSDIEEFQREGFDAVGADNDVMPGIRTVTSFIPTLSVSEWCKSLINELNQYHYPEDARDDETPVEKNDHACDALRYVLHTGGDKEMNVGVAGGSDLYE